VRPLRVRWSVEAREQEARQKERVSQALHESSFLRRSGCQSHPGRLAPAGV
jgi:hypothetical protein